ncbi:hypothetical protein DXG03_005653 [Asterophora parasitica]|uniref:Uncharacterized protein n=1 Tax=Asterophora parasitica TaxID=117018 RepID=A0A9P7FZQ6_9AGAR|nr:hypothetical protein DXG03_005653 [Asterophora parasitica]
MNSVRRAGNKAVDEVKRIDRNPVGFELGEDSEYGSYDGRVQWGGGGLDEAEYFTSDEDRINCVETRGWANVQRTGIALGFKDKVLGVPNELNVSSNSTSTQSSREFSLLANERIIEHTLDELTTDCSGVDTHATMST